MTMASTFAPVAIHAGRRAREVLGLFKLRIGFFIMVTALVKRRCVQPVR